MTIQEAFECMVNGTRVYCNDDKDNLKYILCINNDNDVVLASNKYDGIGISHNVSGVSIYKKKQKKRYWIWDIEFYGIMNKCDVYLDEYGKDTNGNNIYTKFCLIKKHENEFIDVEVGK